MQGIESIRCQSCGCDYFKAKGKNVRFFWYIVGAVVGVLLALFMLGSALGCELCFECAEACDMTELAYCGRDCDQETDNCVANSCKGTQCGEKQEVGRCDEKWDCSHCGGYVEYTITLVLDENNETVLKVDQREQLISEVDYIEPRYIPGKGSTYYEFCGYFDKKGTKQYFDYTGSRVRSLKGSMKLYAQYKEKNLGEEYQLIFNTKKDPAYGSGNWFPAPANLPVIVGDYVSGMPEAPEIPGYTFKGWYNANGALVVSPSEINDWEFHLYDVEHAPENPNKAVVLDAVYVQNEYDVTFHYADNTIDTRKVEHGTILQSFWDEYNRSNHNDNYRFFGWADTNSDNIEDVLDPNKTIVVTESMHLYEVKRDWVTLYFYYDRFGENAFTYEKKFYEGETCVFSQLMYRDATECEDSNSMLTLNEKVQDAGLHPGYLFKDGWCIGRTSSYTEEYVEVSPYQCTFYADLEETSYTIKYMVDLYGNDDFKNMNQYAQQQGMVTNYKYGEANKVVLWNCQAYLDAGLIFEGWYVQGEDQNTIYKTTLNIDRYGDVVLVAVYRR